MTAAQLFITCWVLLIAVLAVVSHLYEKRQDRKAREKLQDLRFQERENKRVADIRRSATFLRNDRYYHDF